MHLFYQNKLKTKRSTPRCVAWGAVERGVKSRRLDVGRRVGVLLLRDKDELQQIVTPRLVAGHDALEVRLDHVAQRGRTTVLLEVGPKRAGPVEDIGAAEDQVLGEFDPDVTASLARFLELGIARGLEHVRLLQRDLDRLDRKAVPESVCRFDQLDVIMKTRIHSP